MEATKQHLAKKKWWSTKSPEERSAIMSERTKKMWANIPISKKRARLSKMNKGRLLTKS